MRLSARRACALYVARAGSRCLIGLFLFASACAQHGKDQDECSSSSERTSCNTTHEAPGEARVRALGALSPLLPAAEALQLLPRGQQPWDRGDLKVEICWEGGSVGEIELALADPLASRFCCERFRPHRALHTPAEQRLRRAPRGVESAAEM